MIIKIQNGMSDFFLFLPSSFISFLLCISKSFVGYWMRFLNTQFIIKSALPRTCCDVILCFDRLVVLIRCASHQTTNDDAMRTPNKNLNMLKIFMTSIFYHHHHHPPHRHHLCSTVAKSRRRVLGSTNRKWASSKQTTQLFSRDWFKWAK